MDIICVLGSISYRSSCPFSLQMCIYEQTVMERNADGGTSWSDHLGYRNRLPSKRILDRRNRNTDNIVIPFHYRFCCNIVPVYAILGKVDYVPFR